MIWRRMDPSACAVVSCEPGSDTKRWQLSSIPVCIIAGSRIRHQRTLQHRLGRARRVPAPSSCQVAASPCSEWCCEPDIQEFACTVSKPSADPNSCSHSSGFRHALARTAPTSLCLLLRTPRTRAEEACYDTREHGDVIRTDSRCLRCVGTSVAPTAPMFGCVS